MLYSPSIVLITCPTEHPEICKYLNPKGYSRFRSVCYQKDFCFHICQFMRFAVLTTYIICLKIPFFQRESSLTSGFVDNVFVFTFLYFCSQICFNFLT